MRVGLWVVTVLALGVGFMVPEARTDADLVLLLRFMAGVKALMALGAVLLIDWRLGRATGPRLAVGYLAAAALMAVSPGLIWGMAHIVLGAVCFHAGLILGAAIAWTDRGAVTMPRAARHLRLVHRSVPNRASAMINRPDRIDAAAGRS